MNHKSFWHIEKNWSVIKAVAFCNLIFSVMIGLFCCPSSVNFFLGLIFQLENPRTSLAHFVRCAVWLVFRRLCVRPHIIVEIWSWKNFCGHSLPITDSSKAVVSYWWKYWHLVLANLQAAFPGLTDIRYDVNSTEWAVMPQNKQIETGQGASYLF